MSESAKAPRGSNLACAVICLRSASISEMSAAGALDVPGRIKQDLRCTGSYQIWFTLSYIVLRERSTIAPLGRDRAKYV